SWCAAGSFQLRTPPSSNARGSGWCSGRERRSPRRRRACSICWSRGPVEVGEASRGVDVEALARAVQRGERRALAKAITLVESTRADDRALTARLLELLGGAAKATMRVGVSGVPGAGKSTFIDALGALLVEAGHKVAVLSVDPSSART